MVKGVTTKITYVCDICGHEWPTEAEADTCYQRGFTPSVKQGDIVLADWTPKKQYRRFGWFDGDSFWIESSEASESHSLTGKLYSFYYVVTFVDGDAEDKHRPRYHLLTKAMSGKQGYTGGYTFDEGHDKPHVVDNPPEYVVATAKELIGRRTDWLL